MATAAKTLTLEEFLRLREKKPALEFEEGRVTQKVSPKTKHSRLQYRLSEAVNVLAEPAKLAFAFPELRETYAERSYVPDVSVFTWQRLPRDEHGELLDDVFVPPDIAIEILSPGQNVNALVRRCLWYVGNGVRLALLVDPYARTVRRFLPDEQPITLTGADPVDFGDILPGFDLTVEQLFASLTIPD